MFRLAYTELKLSKFCGGNKKMGTLRGQRLQGYRDTGVQGCRDTGRGTGVQGYKVNVTEKLTVGLSRRIKYQL